jgi:hypothetical protein
MNKWQPLNTIPYDRKFLARVFRQFAEDYGNWPLVLGPVIWEKEMERFTDLVGNPINTPIEGGIQRIVGWMEWPEDFDV